MSQSSQVPIKNIIQNIFQQKQPLPLVEKRDIFRREVQSVSEQPYFSESPVAPHTKIAPLTLIS